MGVIRNIALAVLAISFITFVALFGQLPALRKTPIGWLQRLLCLHIPNGLKEVDQRTTGGAVTARGKRVGQYLFYEKNPIVLVIFLGLTTGSISLFLLHAIPRLSTLQIIPIPLLVTLPYIFTYLSVRHQAHYITPSTIATRMHDYPYDHTIFHPGATCSTCQLPKPPRSKHCSLCGVCVAMCDHHCPWINNCVGQGNYRHFLGLLLSLGVMEIYGAGLSYSILSPFLATDPTHPFFSRAHAEDVLVAVVVAINAGGLSIAGVGMLAAATAALPLGLLAYHCYLIWAGMTTNESQKWADLREDMAGGFVFRGSREALRQRRVQLGNNNDHLRPGDGELTASYRSGSASAADAGGVLSQRDWAEGLGHRRDEPDVEWPVRSDQIVVRTRDGQLPTGQETLWTRVWSLSDVVNLYDLGGWDNLLEMLKGR